VIRTEFPPEERRKRTRRPRSPSNPTRSEASSHYPTLPPREQNPEIDRETSTRSTDPGEPKHEEGGGEQSSDPGAYHLGRVPKPGGAAAEEGGFRCADERAERRGRERKRGGAGPGGKSRGAAPVLMRSPGFPPRCVVPAPPVREMRWVAAPRRRRGRVRLPRSSDRRMDGWDRRHVSVARGRQGNSSTEDVLSLYKYILFELEMFRTALGCCRST